MKKSTDELFKQVISGEDLSTQAKLLRAAAACAEPFYAGIMCGRNLLYNAGIFPARALGKAALSVGNITTGGTGKTPVVRWLAQRLQSSNQHPVILLRGYKSTAQGKSDEQEVLAASGLTVIANPSRVRGAATALAKFPQTTVFILDDGMQHRRARRNFELILINTTEPFGFGRVFPRGLLREPLSGLKRADAILLTHADEVTPGEIDAITFTIRKYHKSVRIYHCNHVIVGLRSDSGLQPIESLSGKKYFAFCGIGSPASFFWRLGHWGGTSTGTHTFDDHHDYTAVDIDQLATDAKTAGAEMMITTTKDWVKVQQFAAKSPLPILRVELALTFWQQDGEDLFRAITAKLS
jgi:tetraacyldisaccharide 4'-kinase